MKKILIALYSVLVLASFAQAQLTYRKGATECSTASCDLNLATTLNSKGICLDDGTNCVAINWDAFPNTPGYISAVNWSEMPLVQRAGINWTLIEDIQSAGINWDNIEVNAPIKESMISDLQSYLTAESDPQVGAVTNANVCQGDGSAVQCNLPTTGSGNAVLSDSPTFTTNIDTPEIANESGDLKIQPDVQGNVVLFGDTDVADDAAGKLFYIHRMAAEGDAYLAAQVKSDKEVKLFTNSSIEMTALSNMYMRSTTDGAIVGLGDPWSTNVRNKIRMYSYIASGVRYIQFYGSDTTDYFELSRSGTQILGLDIQMPLITDAITIGTGSNFTIGSTQWNSGDSIDGTKVANADLGDIDVAAGVWTIESAAILSAINWDAVEMSASSINWVDYNSIPIMAVNWSDDQTNATINWSSTDIIAKSITTDSGESITESLTFTGSGINWNSTPETFSGINWDVVYPMALAGINWAAQTACSGTDFQTGTDANGQPICDTPAGGATAAGAEGNIQFYQGGNLAGSNDLNWDDSGKILNVNGTQIIDELDMASGSFLATIKSGTLGADVNWTFPTAADDGIWKSDSNGAMSIGEAQSGDINWDSLNQNIQSGGVNWADLNSPPGNFRGGIIIDSPDEDSDYELPPFPYGITIYEIGILAQGSTVTGGFQECDANGANCLTIADDSSAQSGTTLIDTGIPNPEITANSIIKWVTTSVGGTVTRVAAWFNYYYNEVK